MEICPPNNLFHFASFGLRLVFVLFFFLIPFLAEVDSSLEGICLITTTSVFTKQICSFSDFDSVMIS